MVGIINREPHITKDIIRYFYVNAINDAQDSIKIISPYFTLSHKLKKALKNAVKRGVKVEIMLSTKSDIPLTPDCGFYNAQKLMKGRMQYLDVYAGLPPYQDYHGRRQVLYRGQCQSQCQKPALGR